MNIQSAFATNGGKHFRQGQILKVVAAQPIANQDELRRTLNHLGVRVTQATLSRDIQELRLVKTQSGYRSASALPQDVAPLPQLTRAIGLIARNQPALAPITGAVWEIARSLNLQPRFDLALVESPPAGD